SRSARAVCNTRASRAHPASSVASIKIRIASSLIVPPISITQLGDQALHVVLSRAMGADMADFRLKNGLVHVYTGDGKGKTSAALGVALRMLGWGARVCMVQFVKGYADIGEAHFARD